MINLEELRQGHWVWNNHNRKPEKVYGIYETLVMLDYNDLYDEEEIDPIPLSLDLFRDLGFSIDGDYLGINFDGKFIGWIRCINGVFAIWCCANYDTIRLQYFHELQDFLRLCKIEIEFEFYEQRKGIFRIRREESSGKE